MNINGQDIMIGLIAGAATALLCLGVATGSGLSILLYLLSAVPIMVAGLGWSLAASIIATFVATIAVFVIANEMTALFVVLTTALPAAACAYWMTLSRPAEEIGGPQGKLVWFPFADVLFRMCLMIGAAFIIIGIAINYGQELMKPVLDELVANLQINNPDFAFSPEARTQFDAAIVSMMPFMQPLMWTCVMIGNLYIAIKITATSGQLKRPSDDFPTAMRMPKPSLIPFGIAALLSLVGGAAGLGASAILGGLAAGFMLSGFALFHAYSRGRAWRPFGMFVLYFATVLTMLPPFLMFLIGLFSLARNMPISNPPHNNSNE
ncbi:DUF2232 domain-containing protein [Ahrensia sp. 13_GOM-1096m]|uniref:DUF2232 domain-containing protein n=1 Tax=Ahrensia sp. 13_GOM-1096m TaxID=1380380 RepID=UPI00047C2097|nr:DUF2232 domain-containing protein [Ahrensia sp. 13_GOM-1096m]